MGLPLLRCFLASITSSISCTLSVLSSTGMLEKAWKKANSQRHEKILLLWRRIMKRSELRQLREKERRKDTATSSERSILSYAMLATRSLSLREATLHRFAAQTVVLRQYCSLTWVKRV